MLVYKKTIAAGIAWVAALLVALTDFSINDTEAGSLAVGLLGVYAVYKARNATPEA